MRTLRGAWLLVLCLFAVGLTAQPLVKSAIQVDAGNTRTTGATFGYRLTYNCSSTSGPCLNAQVVDLLPAEVQYVSTVPASPTGDVAAINVTNNFGGSGRTRVQFVMINPLPAGNSGDLVINVRFPNGTTPDGTQATNTADAVNLDTAPGTFTTPPVTVTAVATVQVNLQKTLTTTPANLDMPESYRLRISVPNDNGALALTAIGPVTDTLPPGTVFTGATPAADCQPGCVGTTPATVTWTSPCAVPLNPNSNCDIAVNVTFPSATFPSGTLVTNSFTATATPLGQPAQTFGPGQLTHLVTTFVPNPGAGFTKNMAGGTPNPPTLNQTFSYDFNITNSGNVPLDNIVVVDTLPVEMQVTSVTTGAYTNVSNFAAGEGVRVSYEKNTALGVFTLWGSSPNTTASTLLTAPPPGLGAGEYITRIRWEFGQAQPGMTSSTRPVITGRIVNPDNAGGPVAIGDGIQNCAAYTAVYTAGPTNVNRNDCETFTLSGPFVQLNPAKENLSGGGPFNPGQSVSWRLRVRSGSQSSDPVPLESLIVTDLLPVNLNFSGWTFDAQGTGLPAPQSFEQLPNFAGSGRTLLRWRWNAGSGNLGVSQQVWINITTTIRNGALSGNLPNDVTIDSDAPGLALRCGTSQTDSLDLDSDGNTAETLCRATGTITVAGIAQLISSKTIQGTCDGGAVATSAGTLTGGGIEYHLRVQNVGTVPMRNFVLIDILPFVGDTGVRDTNPRGSQWSPLLAAPIVPPAGTTIYYSTSGNPCRAEVGGPTSSCDPPNWTTVAPEPIASVRSFKLEFGDRVVNPFDFVEFTFVMTTPGNVPPAAVAYNSFAYQADRADGFGPLAAEPQKVSIALGSCDAASLGDFVWVDTNANGMQDDGPTGLNGVPVTLYAPGADGIPGTFDDVPLASTITSNSPGGAPGWYTFPGLAPGTYFVQVARPPAYTFSPRDIGADTADSDAALDGSSHAVTLGANETNPTLDFGLVATAFGAVGDYVWFDQNSNGIQDEPLTSGINGVTVRLYLDDGDGTAEPGTGDPLVATTVTADDVYGRPGYYLFEALAPGLPYFLEFVQPAAAVARTTGNTGGDDTVDSDPSPAGLTPLFSVAALEVNRTFDAGFIAPPGNLALGDQVWRDTDNDGVYEPENGETGIDDVRLDLYRDVNGDGEPTVDEFSGSTTTATTGGFAGRYLFNELAPGNFIVVVAPENFGGGGALSGLASSTGNDPAPDPDNDVNGDDNGAAVGALIASRPVTLTNLGEPTSEDGNNATNLTVDFGFAVASTPLYDYGDAPDVGAGTSTGNYNTTALDNGPRHTLGVPNAPYLGPCVDSDTGFAQNSGATADDTAAGAAVGTCSGGDDEDGVTVAGSYTPGSSSSVFVTSGGPAACRLDAWIDWNQNGAFEAGEQIATAQTIATGPAVLVAFSVPAGALPGTTYARFRCSSTGGLTPAGAAGDGEVEDYAISVTGTDFGDAPASYGDAVHQIHPQQSLYLGACVDTEAAALTSAGANGDDANAGTSRVGTCLDDEDGVLFTSQLNTCTLVGVTVTSTAAGLLDAWIDYNQDGDFGDAGEKIFTSQAVVAGANPLTFSVPCSAVPGATYARFRLSTLGSSDPTLGALDGEVEDYTVTIGGNDFGDAPDTYATTFAANGPRHLLVPGFSLGATIDTDADGQPSAGATGDGADEDGVTFSAATACSTFPYTVFLTNTAGLNLPRLDAWIDFDGDGAFNDPRDRIASGVPLVAGANNLSASVPCNVLTRGTYARFRLTNGGTFTPGGPAASGEVEDYALVLQGYDFGDAPAPHPTLLASNGARHVVLAAGNPTLGPTADTEADGQPNASATGDDLAVDDEDGVTVPSTLVAGTTGSIGVSAGTTGGNVSCWLDFNDDGDWTDGGEQVVTNLALAGNASSSPAFAVPANAIRGNRALRCRISSALNLGSIGAAADGEVEDYLVSVTGYDLGDAPAPYPTLVAGSGARHTLLATNNPTLGATVDPEGDGQPSAAFNGDDSTTSDDEDGVTVESVFVPSTSSSITLTAGTTGGIVSCWIDFDRDGNWSDAGEQVVTNLALGANASASPAFSVPAAAAQGTTGLRCRISTLGGLTPTGDAPDGEVEDHAVLIGTADFGDAPDTYGTTLAADGARHGVVTGFSLGATVDSEPQGQPSTAADGDGADEDGVTLPASLTACASTSLTVTLTNTAAVATPRLDAWIDFDGNGVFDAGDRIATSFALTAGANAVPLNVPCSAVTAASYARFRLSSGGVATPAGAALEGEVEDYAVIVQGLDFGDAADPAYPTLLASNGARHAVLLTNNPTLGAVVDTEADGAPNAAATGDDTAGSDDEDGISFPIPLLSGTTGSVTVQTGATGGYVNLWVDFNDDGDWNDAGEQQLTDQLLAANTSQAFAVNVPPGVASGNLAVRARIASQPGVGVSGAALDGEVEDHLVAVGPQNAQIGVAMMLVESELAGACGVYDLTFDVRLANLGNVTLSNVQATTPLSTVFVSPATYTVTSISSTDLTVDPTYNGGSNTNLLLPGATLTPGQTATIRIVVHLVAECANRTYTVSTNGSGETTEAQTVTDQSQDGPNPDPDDDEVATDNNVPTPVVITAIQPIPTLTEWALLLLAAMLAMVALRRMA
ncbi:MAG TPA: GEVED domain-containing protein [Thermoanaerobaculia bacterium]|jgi:uncharacterized repeat protein (TIGR01451 family)